MSGSQFKLDPESPAVPQRPTGVPLPPTHPGLPQPPVRSFPPAAVIYFTGFLLFLFLLWVRFHPTMGQRDPSDQRERLPTAVQHFVDAEGGFTFSGTNAQRFILLLAFLSLGFLAATMWRAGRRRGTFVLALCGVWLTVVVGEQPLKSMLPVGAMLLGGALFTPRGERTIGTRLAAAVGVGCLVAFFCLPLAPRTNFENKAFTTVSSGYDSVLLVLEREFIGLGTSYEDDLRPTDYDPLLGLAFQSQPLAALALLVLAPFVWWSRPRKVLSIAVLGLLVLVVAGDPIRAGINAAGTMERPTLSAFAQFWIGLGEVLRWQYVATALPLAAAIAEATRALPPRRALR